MSNEKKDEKLKAGETVKLKCGIGPIMMLETGEFGGMHTCVWFDKDYHVQRYDFPADFLVRTEIDERC